MSSNHWKSKLNTMLQFCYQGLRYWNETIYCHVCLIMARKEMRTWIFPFVSLLKFVCYLRLSFTEAFLSTNKDHGLVMIWSQFLPKSPYQCPGTDTIRQLQDATAKTVMLQMATKFMSMTTSGRPTRAKPQWIWVGRFRSYRTLSSFCLKPRPIVGRLTNHTDCTKISNN